MESVGHDFKLIRNAASRFHLREHPVNFIFAFQFCQPVAQVIRKQLGFCLTDGFGMHDPVLQAFKRGGLGTVADGLFCAGAGEALLAM